MKKSLYSALLLIGISLVPLCGFAGFDMNAVKDLYQPTQRSRLYSKDPAYTPNYRFGIKYTFMPYQDPDMHEAIDTNNPLLNPAYDSYNLIVIVNKFDRRDQWGRAQTMRVYKRNVKENDGLIYYWYVSTGMDGFGTNAGYFVPQSFSSRHWSSQYDAPMRSSVFFLGGKALHASIDSDSLKALGTPYSHGCVHVEDNRAEELFHLIGHSGYGSVDLIDQKTGKLKLENGRAIKVQATKTLIIVH
ncbi:MAG TPA: L,D-transpeptidase [Pseudobdellovibrionaceae bacterium]